jgi:hypothetical protein
MSVIKDAVQSPFGGLASAGAGVLKDDVIKAARSAARKATFLSQGGIPGDKKATSGQVMCYINRTT